MDEEKLNEIIKIVINVLLILIGIIAFAAIIYFSIKLKIAISKSDLPLWIKIELLK